MADLRGSQGHLITFREVLKGFLDLLMGVLVGVHGAFDGFSLGFREVFIVGTTFQSTLDVLGLKALGLGVVEVSQVFQGFKWVSRTLLRVLKGFGGLSGALQ